MIVKEYRYDDPELLRKIVHLLGNVEWEKEHDQPLRRNPTKTFILLEDGDKMVSMFSVNKNVLGDFHTEPQYRNKGFFERLFSSYDIKNGMYCMTRNEHVKGMLLKMGFVNAGQNGRFAKMKKEVV